MIAKKLKIMVHFYYKLFAFMLVIISLIHYGEVEARHVVFDNNQPMLDDQGNILDAHDGTIQKFHADGPYYMHAVSYGLCEAPADEGCVSPNRCGFRHDHNVSIYTSWDLSSGSWAFQGYAFPFTARPPGILYRPAVVYNRFTEEYVLWWNYVHPNGTYAGYAAATALTPQGPFTLRQAHVNVTYERADVQAGDFHLFVDDDDDGQGYVVYSAGFWITVEVLTKDFLGVTGEMFDGFRGREEEWGFEAPVMFKRQGLYYLTFGPMCCFCYQGSGVRIYTSSSPLGPYTFQGQDLACYSQGEEATKTSFQRLNYLRTTKNENETTSSSLAEEKKQQPWSSRQPKSTPDQGCLFYSEDMLSSTRSQQNFIFEVLSGNGEITYMWTGDRWMQSPDGLKGHEPQFWVPLVFDDEEEGKVQRIEWLDSFVLDVYVPPQEEQQLEVVARS